MGTIPPVKEYAEEEIIETVKTDSAEIDPELGETNDKGSDEEDKGEEETAENTQDEAKEESNGNETTELGEKEREYLINQLNAQGILTAKNIGNKKLLEKAQKA